MSANLLSESIAYHEQSEVHALARSCYEGQKSPATAPALIAFTQLNEQYSKRMSDLLRNAHAIAKHRRPICHYCWLCELGQQHNGADIRSCPL